MDFAFIRNDGALAPRIMIVSHKGGAPRELLSMPHGAGRDLGSGPPRLRWIWQKRDSAPDLTAKFG